MPVTKLPYPMKCLGYFLGLRPKSLSVGFLTPLWSLFLSLNYHLTFLEVTPEVLWAFPELSWALGQPMVIRWAREYMNGLLPSLSVSDNTSLSSSFFPLTEIRREIGRNYGGRQQKKVLKEYTQVQGWHRIAWVPDLPLIKFELGKIDLLLRASLTASMW